MLVDGDDPDFLIELLEEYMNNAEVSLEAIRYAIQAKETVTVVTTAHTLKGASSNIGAVSMADLSKQLEFLGRQDTLNGAVELIGQLEQEFVEVKQDPKKEI